MDEMNSTKLKEILSKAEDSFGDMPVVIHDGEHFYSMGRISVLEVPQLKVMGLVLQIGAPKDMEPLLESHGGKVLRDGDEDWMQEHAKV